MNFELIKLLGVSLDCGNSRDQCRRPEGQCRIRQKRGLFQVCQLHMG